MLRHKFHIRLDFWFFVRLIIITAILLFLVYPFSTLIIRSFFSSRTEGFTLENFRTFFTKSYYYTALLNSLYCCVLTTVTTTVIGVPIAYLMTRYNIWGKKLIHIMIVSSLMSPPFIGAYAWIILLGRSGVLTRFFESFGITLPAIYGQLGIIIVFTLKLFPYIYLYASSAMGSIDSSLEEAAENLGSSKWRRLTSITLPLVFPSIAAGAVMVFMTSLADFGTPMLIGEGFTVLPVMIYNQYMSEMGGNANLASALSVVVVVCSTLVLVLQKKLIDRKNYVMTALRPPKEISLHGFKRFIASAPVFIIVFTGFLPQVVVLVTSFIKTSGPMFVEGFSLNSYKSILSRLSLNIKNTYLFALAAIIIIVLVGSLISYLTVRKKGIVSSLLDWLLMFPFVIPGAVLGISLIIAFNKRPLILTGTAFIIVVSYVVRKLPYTVRSGSAYLKQMDPSIEEASVNLGVSPQKTFFKITLPMMMPGILSGAILSWITCVNELSSSIMLYGGRTSTVSVAIYTEVVRNSYGTAAALATILTLTTIISLLVFMKVTKGKGSFI